MAYVRDVMKKDIITVKSNENLRKISKMLIQKKICNIPVVNEKNNLIGIVSEKDILRVMESKDFTRMTAKDAMTSEVTSVKEEDSLEYVSKIFIGQPYRHLPVTRNRKIVGIITRENIINSFMSDYY